MKKPALVLLISILIFAGFILLADKGLADFIQTRFYNQSIISSFAEENKKDAELARKLIYDLLEKFADALDEPAVRRSFLYSQSSQDIFERSRYFGILLETTTGLQAVQFIDSNGIRVHYSTSSRDILSLTSDSITYRNYTDDQTAVPFEKVSVPADGNSKFTMDDQNDRIIFSYPFFDSMDVYRGTALFYVSVRALSEMFISEGRIKANDDVSVISSPPGILLGTPDSSKQDIPKIISAVWNEGIQDRVILDADESGIRFSLISLKTRDGLFFGRLVNDALFYLSNSMRNILYASIFLTFYLTLLFLLNFKPNSVMVVQNRIKNLRENLFEQLFIKKDSRDRAKWVMELEQRRDDVRSELKRNLKISASCEKKIDRIIDNGWDELLSVMKSGIASIETQAAAGNMPVDEKALEAKAETAEAEEIEELETIEELEAIEKAEVAAYAKVRQKTDKKIK